MPSPPPDRTEQHSGAGATSADGADGDDLGALPRTNRTSRWDRVWRPFWVLPMVVVIVALLAGYLMPELDRTLGEQLPFVFPGGPSGARDLLGTIAGAMISVTGLVFSITMVVVQLASSQYSPRVLGDFLSSRVTQMTLGIFAASFTYALTVLRSVEGDSGEGGAFVPQVSVTLSFLLVLASVGMFLAFIHHITNSIQVSSIVSHLGDGTVDVVGRYLPEAGASGARLGAQTWQPDDGLVPTTVPAQEHGAVVEVDHHGLVSWAAEHRAVVEVLPQVGMFIPEGAPALRVWRDRAAPALEEDELRRPRRMVVVAQDRWFTQDPGFGIRKLVDIAERALSPGINDPTTAVQVLDELHRVLRLTVTRADLPAVVTEDGAVRLVHRPQRVEQLVDLALDEPMYYGRDARQVPRRVVSMVEDLLTASLPAHRPHLRTWLGRAEASVGRADEASPW
ncbi:DUF2254 domain-containing protein [Ornithinimicrobium cerasi]|uniref:Uncharacterized membrane protein n=1 Tax=Ornithinimicrobium cerasi TaxID=2248773 RepID=A0A285VUQ8_9MICO|nr:DUF2254 domain-containing protein [Ornithinimicrobium cerasi]SOC57348.1 Uncharacterized membrane protein [Ornithinimicrobium cerasi]